MMTMTIDIFVCSFLWFFLFSCSLFHALFMNSFLYHFNDDDDDDDDNDDGDDHRYLLFCSFLWFFIFSCSPRFPVLFMIVSFPISMMMTVATMTMVMSIDIASSVHFFGYFSCPVPLFPCLVHEQFYFPISMMTTMMTTMGMIIIDIFLRFICLVFSLFLIPFSLPCS